jgi:predicted RNA-binding Zn-ribbon protein involved in translation (DUF1610 family)
MDAKRDEVEVLGEHAGVDHHCNACGEDFIVPAALRYETEESVDDAKPSAALAWHGSKCPNCGSSDVVEG